MFYGRYMLGTSLDFPIVIFEYDNHPLWFLPGSFFACLLFYMLKTKVVCWNAKSTICSCTLCVIIAKIFSNLPILLPWSIDTAGCIMVFLIIGNVMKQFGIFDKNVVVIRKRIVICLLMGAGYIIMCQMDTVANIAIRMYGKSIILYLAKGIIGSFLCVTFFYFIQSWRIVKLFQMLGKMSLDILCWHVCLYNMMDSLVFRLCNYTLPILKSNFKVIYYIYCVCQIALVVFIIYKGRERLYKFKENILIREKEDK